MTKKDLHIVFGRLGEPNLSRSQIVNNDHGDILTFDDPLSLGPLWMHWNWQNILKS